MPEEDEQNNFVEKLHGLSSTSAPEKWKICLSNGKQVVGLSDYLIAVVLANAIACEVTGRCLEWLKDEYLLNLIALGNTRLNGIMLRWILPKGCSEEKRVVILGCIYIVALRVIKQTECYQKNEYLESVSIKIRSNQKSLADGDAMCQDCVEKDGCQRQVLFCLWRKVVIEYW